MKRFIEISSDDFFNVISAAVRAHMDCDAEIWYDEPLDVSIPAGIGSQPYSKEETRNGYILKQDEDWAIDIMTIPDNEWDPKGIEMIATKVWKVGNDFIDWCDNRDMKIIITK